MDPPLREARGGRTDELQELLYTLRKELEARGERLPPGWTDEAVEDLHQGRLTGWYRPAREGGGEIGFYSVRPDRVFGHVHVLPGPKAPARALELLRVLGSAPACARTPLNVGVSGLRPEEETELGAEWATGPRCSVTRREGLERPVGSPAPPDPGAPPGGAERHRLDEITEAALVDLDLRGFAGTDDADLFARDAGEYGRMLRGILDGQLGRFLPEASCALLTPDGRLAAFLLTVELSPRMGLFADIVVDPGLRRQGYGRYLVAWGLRALSALGHGAVRLWVTETNLPARRLYERTGFRRYAEASIFRQAPGDASPQPQRAR